MIANLWTWRKEDEGSSPGQQPGYILAFNAAEDYEGGDKEIYLTRIRQILSTDVTASKATRGYTQGFYRIVPVGIDVCEITLVQQADLRGYLPKALMNKKVKTALRTLVRIQEMYERNGTSVDEEVRDAFPVPPRLDELEDDQKVVAMRAMKVEVGGLEVRRGRRGLRCPPTHGTIIARSNKREHGNITVTLPWVGGLEEGRVVLTASTRCSPPCSHMCVVAHTCAWQLIPKTLRRTARWFHRPSLKSGHAWTEIKSNVPFVTMHMKHIPPRKGERYVATGRAAATLDCHAIKALAYSFEYCGRERLRISRESGDPVRIVVERRDSNDVTVATVKKMPFPLNNREFVLRMVCFRDGDAYVIATDHVPDEVDYGSKFKCVRGIARSVMRFVPGDGATCEVTVVSYLDAGGHISAKIASAKITSSFNTIVAMREKFQRDAEIDKQELGEWAASCRDVPQTYTPEEISLLLKYETELEQVPDDTFDPLVSPDPFVRMAFKLHGHNKSGMTRAECVIDADIFEVCGYEQCIVNRQMKKRHFAGAGLERDIVVINDHNSIYHAVYDWSIPGISPREFIGDIIWKKADDSNSIVQIFHSSPHDQFPPQLDYVQASSQAIHRYEVLPPLNDVPQTRVTWTQMVDMAGYIPHSFINTKVVSTLLTLSKLRVEFDRSMEIDQTNRQNYATSIRRRKQAYTSEEDKFIADGVGYFTTFEAEKTTREVTLLNTMTRAKTTAYKGHHHQWGWASSTVMASSDEVLAYIYDVCKRSGKAASEIGLTVYRNENGHSQSVYVRKIMPLSILSDRDSVIKYVWKEDRPRSYMHVCGPTTHPDHPVTADCVRIEFFSATRITYVKQGETNVELVMRVDPGGSIPEWVKNHQGRNMLAMMSRIQETFQQTRTLNEYTEADGRCAGAMLCVKTELEKHHEHGESRIAARVRDVFSKYDGLAQIDERYPFFSGMLVRVVENKLRVQASVTTKLCNLSLKDGGKVGAGLAIQLAINLNSMAAVDRWITEYPCLQVRRAKRAERSDV